MAPALPIPDALPALPRVWPGVLGFWVGMGVIESTKAYVFWSQSDVPRSLTMALLGNMPWWLLWATLTPLVFVTARRFRLTGPGWPASAAAHLLIGLSLSALHVGVAGALYLPDQRADDSGRPFAGR